MLKLLKNESFVICVIGFGIIAVFAFMFAFFILADYPKDFNYRKFSRETVYECSKPCVVTKDDQGIYRWKEPIRFIKIREIK